LLTRNDGYQAEARMRTTGAEEKEKFSSLKAEGKRAKVVYDGKTIIKLF
jgi:hypothetical protein